MYTKSSVTALLAAAGLAAAQDSSLVSTLKSQSSLSNLTSLVSMFPDLVNTLSSATNVTILAPSNDAISAIADSPIIKSNDTDAIKAILSYHVLKGTYPASSVMDMPAFIPTYLDNSKYDNVTGGQVVEALKDGDSVEFYSGLLENSTVTTPNLNFSGGIIHVINSVLTLPANVSYTSQQADLTGVTGALQQAGLVEKVDGLKDVTVFAPSNEAFEAIGSVLPNVTTSMLTSILEYHVVQGVVGYSSELTNGTQLKTVNGANVTITLQGEDVFVNGAKVTVPNVLVANGVVHVIDQVLNPGNSSAMASPSASGGSPAFAGASSASSIALTSGVTAPSSTIGPKTTATSSSATNSATTSSKGNGAAVPTAMPAWGAAVLAAGGMLLAA